MPKRKRPSPSPSEPGSETADRVVSRQKKQCMHIIANTQKTLVAALRLGAGFERQKYSRRRKTAKTKNDDKAVARLDAEYAALKGLDIPKVAEQHLRKTILKVKTLREHEGLPDSAKEVEKGEKDAATLNTLARLYKVQGVKKTVDTCIDDLKVALGLTVVVKGGDKKEKGDEGRKTKAQVDVEEEEDEEMADAASDEDGTAFAEFDACIAAPSSADEDSDDSLALGNRPPSAQGDESEDVEDEDEEMESDDEAAAAVPSRGQDRTDDEYSGSEDDGEKQPKAKTKSKAKAPEKVSKSTFIPSLSHAGYVSGSESEAEDLDIDIAPKKNRRGQRARQKIWEQKYGELAKHKAKQERNKGWDPKRGAVSDDRGGRGGRGSTGRGPQMSGENASALGPKITKRDDTGSLHPSWQAAKLAKEKKMAAKPEGTKIVFD